LDQNSIRYIIGQARVENPARRKQERNYIVQRSNINKFKSKLFRVARARICTTHKPDDTGEVESTLAKLVKPQSNIETTIDEFYESPTTACNETFRRHLVPK